MLNFTHPPIMLIAPFILALRDAPHCTDYCARLSPCRAIPPIYQTRPARAGNTQASPATVFFSVLSTALCPVALSTPKSRSSDHHRVAGLDIHALDAARPKSSPDTWATARRTPSPRIWHALNAPFQLFGCVALTLTLSLCINFSYEGGKDVHTTKAVYVTSTDEYTRLPSPPSIPASSESESIESGSLNSSASVRFRCCTLQDSTAKGRCAVNGD
jgi:hypothetical protein